MVKHVGKICQSPTDSGWESKISSLPVPWPVTKTPHRQPGFLADGCNNVGRSHSRTGREMLGIDGIGRSFMSFLFHVLVGDFGRNQSSLIQNQTF